MIKNYCIKIMSSVFIMLTIFMVSTFVFASPYNLVEVDILSEEELINQVKITNGIDLSQYKDYKIFTWKYPGDNSSIHYLIWYTNSEEVFTQNDYFSYYISGEYEYLGLKSFSSNFVNDSNYSTASVTELLYRTSTGEYVNNTTSNANIVKLNGSYFQKFGVESEIEIVYSSIAFKGLDFNPITISTTNYTRDVIIEKYKELGGTVDISTSPLVHIRSNYAEYFYFVNDTNVSHLLCTKPTDTWIANFVDSNNNILDSSRLICLIYSHSLNNWELQNLGDVSRNYIVVEDYFFNTTELSVYNDYNVCLYEGSYVSDSGAKKIIYEVNYSEDNKTATLTAEIKNGAEGDKLYYSLLGYSITGKLMNPIELNQSQITYISLKRNTLIHLQALDSER